MVFGFETDDENEAMGALLVYGVYRSRDPKRFKVSPDMWGIIERAVKSAAKRALDLPDFIEKLKPKLSCSSIQPRYMKTDNYETISMHIDRETGEIIQPGRQEIREFWVRELAQADDQAVLGHLYRATALLIALVRDRLERERPVEAAFEVQLREEDAQ